MFKSATVFLMAMAGSASATDSFNVKLKFLREGMDMMFVGDGGIFAPASDDNLGNSCDPFNPMSCLNFQCEHYDRSLDVFSEYLTLQGLSEVSIETTAPYAVYVQDGNNVVLAVGNKSSEWRSVKFCTGYNGFQSTWCTQLPNVPEAFERTFWNGGSNPGAGSPGWGRCEKCSTCYVSNDMFGTNNCDFLCDGYDAVGFPAIQSAGTNASNGVAVGLFSLALTSLSLFVGA